MSDPSAADDPSKEFPILCESCLGENPYIRMTKRPFGKECKICLRPFTHFRWHPGQDLRFKQTEICPTCARIKNCCQTCILDLEYHLPIRIRDQALGVKEDIARHDRNREYYLNAMTDKIEKDGEVVAHSATGKASMAGQELIRKFIKSEPYYREKLAEMIDAEARGEKPKEPLDPLKRLLEKRTDEKNLLVPPEDLSIRALFMTGIDETIVEQDLRDFFGRFGDIKSVTTIHRSRCAFVNFTSRGAAERAAQYCHYDSTINNKRLKVQWARQKATAPMGPTKQKAPDSIGPLRGEAPKEMPAEVKKYGAVPPPPGSSVQIQYPSQDPTRLGSVKSKLSSSLDGDEVERE